MTMDYLIRGNGWADGFFLLPYFHSLVFEELSYYGWKLGTDASSIFSKFNSSYLNLGKDEKG